MSALSNNDYKEWLNELKKRIYSSQIKAAIKVNTELLRLYWDLGQDIVVRQMEASWGSGFFEELSKDLRSEFPGMQGFSVTNLKYCKRFYLFYSQGLQIRQQLVDEFEEHSLFQIPWGHHLQIITKCETVNEAMFYIQKTIENGWSRAVLMNFIEAGLFEAKGKSQTNFSRLLPKPQSDLAAQILKRPLGLVSIAIGRLWRSIRKRSIASLVVRISIMFIRVGGRGKCHMESALKLY